MLSIVGDRYLIERELGSGAAACVYLARDQRLDRAVAVKILRDELARALGHQRFLREIKFASGLRHPHLVPLLDFGETEGHLWYVMPLIAGGTLRERLRKETQLKVDDTVRWGAQIADALAYAHQHGIVHRDVKPENILLDGDHALLADFGIARGIDAATIDTLTSAGIAVGTPAYMSPEQAAGAKDVDGRSDVYSLSCVLYECLAGVPPFVGPTPQSVIAQRFAHAPHPVSSYRATTPPLMADLIGAGLALVPADRITADELTKGLRAQATGEAPVPMRASTPVSTAATRRRSHTPAIAALLAAIAVLAAIVWFRAPKRAELDRNKVVLFPITVKGARDSVAVAAVIPASIAADLQGVPPLSLVEGENLLRESATAGARTSHEHRISAARSTGAAYFIDGELSVLGDSATLVLRLLDTEGDSVISRSQATRRGGTEQAKQLALLAMGELLPPLLDPGRAVDLRVLAGRRPRAIALFLLGERQFRQSQYATALAHYQQALALDSNLAIAALNAARSARSQFNETDARKFVALAIARDSLLPGANAYLARGLSWMYQHVADSALFYLQRATVVAPEWSELQTTLGDVHFYIGVDGMDADSAATDKYVRARELDSTFTPTLYHLAWLALRRQDPAAAQRYLAEYQRGGSSDTAFVRAVTVGADCQARGVSAVRWDSLATTTSAALITLGQNLIKGGADLQCSKAAFRAVFDQKGPLNRDQFGALVGLNAIAMAIDDTAALQTLTNDPKAVAFHGGNFVLFDAVASGNNAAADRIALEMSRNIGQFGPDELWALGAYLASRGQGRELDRVVRALHDTLRKIGPRPDTMMLESLRARAALLRGDTALAEASLARRNTSASFQRVEWGLYHSRAADNALLADIALARGRPAEARRMAERISQPYPLGNVVFLRRALAIRLQAARRMNDEPEAREVARMLARLTPETSIPAGK